MSQKARVKQAMETMLPGIKVKEEKDGTLKAHLGLSINRAGISTLDQVADAWNFKDYDLRRSGTGITLVVTP